MILYLLTPWPHWTDQFTFRVQEVFPMVSETPVSLYFINVILSDIRNKWLGNPFTFSVSEQCGHFCIFLWNPYFLEDFSDSERKSVSSVWPGRNTGKTCLRIAVDIHVCVNAGVETRSLINSNVNCMFILYSVNLYPINWMSTTHTHAQR